MASNRAPRNRLATGIDSESELVALCVALIGGAKGLSAAERRNDGKTTQEAKVKDYLTSLGFTGVPPVTITTIVKGPGPMQFGAECQLGERKADVVVRLHDTRLLAIECKVSNSATNSVKRLNNDAAVKAETCSESMARQGSGADRNRQERCRQGSDGQEAR